MIRWLLVFCLLYSVSAVAQKQQHTDSLLMVKKYLLLLQQTVTDNKTSLKQKVVMVDSVLKSGTYYENLLKNHLLPVTSSEQEREQVQQSFRFILQSAILFKTDVKQQEYKPGKSSTQELQYMKTNIPLLVQRIDQYCGIVAGKGKRQ